MSDNLNMDNPALYRIQVRGAVDELWFDYYDNMAIETENGSVPRPVTTLTGRVVDQSALQGILDLLHSMNLPLLLVEWLPEEQ